jgi:hypothetical protein
MGDPTDPQFAAIRQKDHALVETMTLLHKKENEKLPSGAGENHSFTFISSLY